MVNHGGWPWFMIYHMVEPCPKKPWLNHGFYAREHIAVANSVCPSVRPSVRHVYCIKTANRIVEILSRSDRPIILVFRHQSTLRKSEGVTPNGAPIQGGSDFRLICGYMSETVRDRGIVTMEDDYKVVCALSNGAVFDDLEWPRIPVSRSHYILKATISQTVHPIHSMCGSRQGFSGSADRMALFPVR